MGLKTRKKKIDTVLQMQPPINLKQLRDFMGMVNYYKDMWPQRSHISSPLTAETGAPKKGVKAPPFKWTPEIQIVFEEMKALMAAEVLCAYPNHKKPFKIYTDASNYQLEACIMQDDRPVAYYSRKLNSAQRNYATIDKELLCVAATLKEFRSMLCSAELHIYTYNKNILNVGNLSEATLDVGILPDGYQRTNPLPKNPTKQSVPTSREVLPGYFGLPIRIPTLCSLIGPAIGKAQIPWLSCH
jgi:hypothetical protein